MADIIQLLPDAIANQIAAGEVIQRPASVVKELMENSIDAGSKQVQLILKDAGKTLIQVIDDGIGMSETDARLCFERHATSKLRKANDLFTLRTMGFRGEAMASIAAIAQVEMKTRRREDELGILLRIEGSELQQQEPCQAAVGTSLSVKNLFYNVPARRNFLKSNAVEMRHILDEFQRVAIANPEIAFSLHHNGMELFRLPKAKLRQRIVGVLGNHVNKKLVPLEEETDALYLSGYVGKPEHAKKTRGDQFFFVNNRFIKSGYLHHAVMTAYEDLLPEGAYPLYVIFLELDPARIDINVHPTKQEIKFEDERLVYNYLKVTVRHALAQHSLTPTLDFDLESSISKHLDTGFSSDRETIDKNKLSGGNYSGGSGRGEQEEQWRKQRNLDNWQQLYAGLEDEEEGEEQPVEGLAISSSWEPPTLGDEDSGFSSGQKTAAQLHQSYIITQIKSGFLLIDQQAAHERILYERFIAALENQKPVVQTQLFPETLEFSVQDAELLRELLPQLQSLGLDVKEFGQQSFVVQGLPADVQHLSSSKQDLMERLLEQYKAQQSLKLDLREALARALARSAAVKRGQELSAPFMQRLIDELFACEQPHKAPNGRKTLITVTLEELARRFV